VKNDSVPTETVVLTGLSNMDRHDVLLLSGGGVGGAGKFENDIGAVTVTVTVTVIGLGLGIDAST
jgi:hypothetical protein